MNLTNRRNYIGLALAGMLILITFVVWHRVTPTEASGTGWADAKERWPAFVMDYRVESYDWVAGTVRDYDVYRYTYNGDLSWRQELIESTNNSRSVGTSSSYDGGKFASAAVVDGFSVDPIFSQESGIPTMATWWLVPMNPAQVRADNRYTMIADGDPRIHMRQTEIVPCSTLQDALPNLCANGEETFERTTDKFHAADTGIPVEIFGRTRGRVTSHILATKLTYTSTEVASH